MSNAASEVSQWGALPVAQTHAVQTRLINPTLETENEEWLILTNDGFFSHGEGLSARCTAEKSNLRWWMLHLLCCSHLPQASGPNASLRHTSIKINDHSFISERQVAIDRPKILPL